ncbi:MAG: peroxiredoxin [Actinobacteria bacterium]|nr:peroxiredoxin [Actinomycetota bacterium]
MTTPETVPSVDIWVLNAEGAPETVNTAEFFGTGRSVLFGVPGAFTPGCSMSHLPGFVEHFDELIAKGVDRVACVSVNDAWAMDAWGKAHGADGKITMLADGNGEFAAAMGLTMDVSVVGLGTRSKRYAAVIDDGRITALNVDESGAVDDSSCSTVLSSLL